MNILKTILTVIMAFGLMSSSWAQDSSKLNEGFEYLSAKGDVISINGFDNETLPSNFSNKAQQIYRFVRELRNELRKQKSPNCMIEVFISYSDRVLNQATFDKKSKTEMGKLIEKMDFVARAQPCSTSPGNTIEISWDITKANEICRAQTYINNLPQQNVSEDCGLYNYLKNQKDWLQDTIESKLR